MVSSVELFRTCAFFKALLQHSTYFARSFRMSREKEEDDWKPLRKSDCRALNTTSSKFSVSIARLQVTSIY